MKKVDDFVYDKFSKSEKFLPVASYSLKKALAKKIKQKYLGTGVFLNYDYQSKGAIVKKTRGFK